MNSNILFVVVLFGSFLLFDESTASACTGEGWINRLNRKCIKVLPDLLTMAEGEAACRAEYNPDEDIAIPTLLQINSLKEQNYLVDYIFTQLSAPVGVWIGAVRINQTEFMWADSSEILYSHWAVDNPSDNVARGCVEMESGLSKYKAGEWRDVTCVKGNWVACQKTPTWTLSDVINAVIKLEEFREEVLGGSP